MGDYLLCFHRMIQLITDNWLLIIVVILFVAGSAAYLLTKNPESNKDMHRTTQEIEEMLRARKEADIRTEVDNKAEAKYLSDYCKSKDETVIF